MTTDKAFAYLGIAYAVASALVAFLTALGAILPGKAGEACHKSALVVGKAVAAVGELRSPKPAPQVAK